MCICTVVHGFRPRRMHHRFRSWRVRISRVEKIRKSKLLRVQGTRLGFRTYYTNIYDTKSNNDS